jgi:hypothetical protein
MPATVPDRPQLSTRLIMGDADRGEPELSLEESPLTADIGSRYGELV